MFIAFGRGKSIPLTPDSANIDLPNEISNTGRIIVNKYIDKIDKREIMLHAEKDLLGRNHPIYDKNGKIMERKKKGRLYSLGGNEPTRKNHRGRLDRLKTVGTFDLGTEMSVLSQVARNLNEQLISGELGGILPIDGNRSPYTTQSFQSSVHTSTRNTPEFRKREFGRRTPLRSPLLHETARAPPSEFKGQHSADDCIQRASPVPSSTKKSRSLSTSSYLKDRLSLDAVTPYDLKVAGAIHPATEAPETESRKIEDDMTSTEHAGKRDLSKDFSYRNRKSMLRKSKRIVRTDSEIFKEGIIDKNEYVLKNNCDIQIHANSESDPSEARDILGAENCRNSSVTSSSYHSRKDSSEIEDICSPKDRQKSTDESSKNLSTDEMDAVFSDSNTDLEKLEKDYKELIKTSLQREYKSDGDTLDEVGKKRNEFGKWKNQSLEHEFDYSNQELMNIIGEQTLSSHSYGTSTDTKDISRICSPESCANGAYSDSGLKHLDERYSQYSKIRSRVYSSSRLGETPTERERLYPLRSNLVNPLATVPSVDTSNLDSISRTTQIRPSNLDITATPPRPKPTHDNPIHSLFEKPFGKFKRVNKLLKGKRFSTSTLYDKKKTTPDEVVKKSPKLLERFAGVRKGGLVETKSAINLSKLSLFSQKPGKAASFFSRKSGMFSATSHSNNELSTKAESKTKLSEVSKSNTELNKYRASPLKSSKRKYSKSEKNNAATGLTANICHSPLSEEFYNKTGSVKLSAMELYEKFCSEDFSGLYKNEHTKRDMHEYRLEQKGLRVIGRYNKNARLLKQKSEPKFNLRSGTGYYHEEDEYYYDNKVSALYGYYNEQDEYYNEYEGEDVEGDYYEDDDEGDYYEDDVEVEDTKLEVEDSPMFIDKEDQDELEFQFQTAGATCLELSLLNSNKPSEVASTGTDSDVDEIYLMPAESKCIDEDECGFENKHFSLEHSILKRSNLKENPAFPQQTVGKGSDETAPKATNPFRNKDDDILTIYRICSKEEIMRISDSEMEESKDAKKQRSTSLQSASLEKAVKEYIKYATSEVSIEPTIMRTDCINIDRTDSLELLSNSSGTMRSRSTLTEYAFDTVRNMNLDSCSTSKLSLSLKSEVFDDFTITPDELKTIQNCEIEDFTLTPEGSIGDSTTEIANNAPTVERETESNGEENRGSLIEDECISGVLVLVDRFLENERNNLHRQMSIDEPSTSKPPSERSRTEFLETSFDETSSDNGESKNASDSYYTANAEQESTTSNDFTIVDLYDDNDNDVDPDDRDLDMEHSVSLFTSELTKEFDRLFSQADNNNCDSINQEVVNEMDDRKQQQQITSDDDCDYDPDSVTDRPKIPSRYSMQKLEPYFIADPPDSSCREGHVVDELKITTATIPVESNSRTKTVAIVAPSSVQSTSNGESRKVTASRLKKIRSQSLGNLNKKTKCFPL